MSQRLLPAGLPRLVEAPLAALGLLASAPFLFLVTVVVRATSRGPALFRQQRIGRHGKPFTLYKLRSMRSAAGGPKVTSSGDARITRVGRWLRKAKLDELPELWNVLVGDMSFVGPRPEVATYVDLDQPLWRRALEARPGLTDPVTLALRNEEELLASVDDPQHFYRQHLQPYKLRGYVRYLEQRSMLSDVAVLWRTLIAILAPARADPPRVDEIIAGATDDQ